MWFKRRKGIIFIIIIKYLYFYIEIEIIVTFCGHKSHKVLPSIAPPWSWKKNSLQNDSNIWYVKNGMLKISQNYAFLYADRTLLSQGWDTLMLCPLWGRKYTPPITISLSTVIEERYLEPETNIGTLVVSLVSIVGLIIVKELNT